MLHRCQWCMKIWNILDRVWLRPNLVHQHVLQLEMYFFLIFFFETDWFILTKNKLMTNRLQQHTPAVNCVAVRVRQCCGQPSNSFSAPRAFPSCQPVISPTGSTPHAHRRRARVSFNYTVCCWHCRRRIKSRCRCCCHHCTTSPSAAPPRLQRWLLNWHSCWHVRTVLRNDSRRRCVCWVFAKKCVFIL